MADQPLYSFTSHINGKNARVHIWPDRIEWERKAVSGGKVAAGIMTLGASVLITSGVRNKNTEMIPIKAISSVTTKKAIINTEMFVNASSGAIGFKCSHVEAATAKDLIQRLILWDGGKGAPVAPVAAAEAAAPAPDHGAQLTSLKGLLDAGILTQSEYDAKKSEILTRM